MRISLGGAAISAELAARANEPKLSGDQPLDWRLENSITKRQPAVQLVQNHHYYIPERSLSLSSLAGVERRAYLGRRAMVLLIGLQLLLLLAGDYSVKRTRAAKVPNDLFALVGGGQSEAALEAALAATTTKTTSPSADQPLIGDSVQMKQALEQEQQSFSEWWSEYWSRQPFPSGYTQSSITLLACLITTIIFLIVVGNLLVCIAIFTEKSLKPTQNWFIASLAVSDMLLGLVVMPFSLARELMGFWVFGSLWCDIHEAVDVLLTTASINTLCLISLDRYWSITQAVSYLKKRTPRRGALMIAGVWFFSAAVSLPPLIGWKKPIVTITANTTTIINHGHQIARHQQREQQQQQQQQVFVEQRAAGGANAEPAKKRFRRQNWQGRPQKWRPPGGRDLALATPLNMQPPDENHLRLIRSLDSILSGLLEPASGAVQQFSSVARRSANQRAEDYEESGQGPEQPDPASTESLYHASNSLLQPIQQQATATPSILSQPFEQQQVQTQTTTTEYPSCQLSDDIGYVLYSALGSFFIPCAVMVFTYIKIFLAARSRARRAISKQTRGQQAANKRLAARQRNLQQQQQQQAITFSGKPTGDQQKLGEPNLAAFAGADPNAIPASNGAPTLEQKRQSGASPIEPIMKGKIVIVERRKSLAQSGTHSAASPIQGADQELPSIGKTLQQQQQQQPPNSATYSCSDSIDPSERAAGKPDCIAEDPDQQEQAAKRATIAEEEEEELVENCTLITSGVKQASASALNASAQPVAKNGTQTDASSVITVMNASMGEIPITRFQFQAPTCSQASAKEKEEGDKSAADQLELELELERRKAAALLKAISEPAKPADELLMELAGEAQPTAAVPDIVVERRATAPVDELGAGAAIVALGGPDRDEHRSGEDQIGARQATNETCFMTIEEDSDMFDAQTGRTIMMFATNASCQKQAAGCKPMLAMAPHQQQQVCGVATCRQRATTRSGSSYCGSSVTINDDDDDDEEDYDDGDDGIDDDDDEEEDDEDDDELLTDDCNGYSGSCALDQYCAGASTCSHCRECQQEEEAQAGQVKGEQEQVQHNCGASSAANLNNSGQSADDGRRRRQPASGSPARLAASKLHHTNQQVARPAANTNDNKQQVLDEAQSLTGDDNLSLTEYRSNEDSSSIIGHDMLDATRQSKPINSERKKSSIGFRLARLGSSAPLSAQSGGLLALASTTQQQQQQQEQQGGTRNLKALRQNFFLKLNQLTAKAAAKQANKSNKKQSAKNGSPVNGKSSAQSSGTSYEPSVDCATTSNVHSNECHQETTAVDEYEEQSQSEYTNPPYHQQQQQQQQQQRVADLKMARQISSADGQVENYNSQQQQRQQLGQADLINSCAQQQGGAGGSNSGKQRNSLQLLLRDQQTDERRTLKALPAATDDLSSGQLASAPKSDRSSLLPISPPGRAQDGSSKVSVAANKQRGGPGDKRGAGANANHTSSTMLSSSIGTAGSGATSNRAYLAADNERHKRKLAKARERRATLILGLIMAAFICSWLPFFTFYVTRALCKVCRDYMPPRLEAFIFWAGYCNSAINPIIYTIFNRDFRRAFRKILFKCL